MTFKVGDLVRDLWEGDIIMATGFVVDAEAELGVVVKVHDQVEVPPLLEILWQHHGLSKCYADDVELVERPEQDLDQEDFHSSQA